MSGTLYDDLQWDDDIVDLDGNPFFEADSYAWKMSESELTIHVSNTCGYYKMESGKP